MPKSIARPEDFLEIRVHILDPLPGLTALCAGYELGKWRSQQLASHLISWLPEFAFSGRDRDAIGAHNAGHSMARAAKLVYTTIKSADRGEIGELLLHIALRQVFDSIPAISKIFFKDSTNDTVKGFDCVHVVVNSGIYELWLGEAKFYKDIKEAIREIEKDLEAHTKADYLRMEFAAIYNKIDDKEEFAAQLKQLIANNNSLDKIFEKICIPVFIAYESSSIKSNDAVTDKFREMIRKEVMNHHKFFSSKNLPQKIKIHLFLLPMLCKADLVNEFDTRLRACQSII
jgi:hypothetical protein